MKASYDSAQGPILVHWRREKERFLYDVTIPPNTTATVKLPVRAEDPKVFEGGKPIREAQGVKWPRRVLHARKALGAAQPEPGNGVPPVTNP